MMKRSERGVAILEFTIVFTIIWAVFWSMVCYVAPLLILQSMHRATAEAAQVASMTVSPELRVTQAKTTAMTAMSWLPASWRESLSADETTAVSDASCPLDTENNPTNCVVVVRLTMDYAANAPLRPIIGLPGVGTIPSLPETLESESRVLLF